MTTLNTLVIGLTIGRNWTNLAKARRYYAAHPDQALHLLYLFTTSRIAQKSVHEWHEHMRCSAPVSRM